MIDIHAHLHDVAFDADRDEVIGRALGAGVTRIITIGTDIEESRKVVACADRYEGVYASVGIHPHFFNEVIEKEFPISNFQIPNKIQNSNFKNEKPGSRVKPGMTSLKEWMSDLKQIAQSSRKLVAIGECGLDYFVREEEGGEISGRTAQKAERPLLMETADAPPAGGTTAVSGEQKEIQKEGFLAQIELAQELNLPLIIHCRPSKGTMDEYEDMFDILSDQDSRFQIPDSRFILHCYMGDTEVTRKFLELPNVLFSFTGNITYPTKKVLIGSKNDLTEVVKMIPIERILAETDCPYLAPQAYRGKRNEPAFVVSIVGKIAEIKGISDEEAGRVTTASAKEIFGI